MYRYDFNQENDKHVKAYLSEEKKEEGKKMMPLQKRRIRTGLSFHGEASPRLLLKKISEIGIEALKHPLPRKGAYKDETGIFDYIKLEEILDQINVLESEVKVWSTAYVDANYAVIEVFDLEHNVSVRLAKEVEPIESSRSIVTEDLSRETRYIRSLYRSIYKLTGYTEGDELKDLNALFRREDPFKEREADEKNYLDPKERMLMPEQEAKPEKAPAKEEEVKEDKSEKIEKKKTADASLPTVKGVKKEEGKSKLPPKSISIEEYFEMPTPGREPQAKKRMFSEVKSEKRVKSLPPVESLERKADKKAEKRKSLPPIESIKLKNSTREEKKATDAADTEDFFTLFKRLTEIYGDVVFESLKEEFGIKYLSELNEEMRKEAVVFLKERFGDGTMVQ